MNPKFRNFISNYLPLILVCLFISLPFVRLMWIPGIIGHTWDWSIPHDASQAWNQLISKLYIWNPKSYGGFIELLNKGETPYWSIVYLLSLMGSDNASKILPLLLALVSAVTMFITLTKMIRIGRFWACIGAVYYALSPYFYMRLVGGHLALLIGYALMPLIIYFAYQLVSTDSNQTVHKNIYLILLVILFSLLSVHIGNIIIGLLLLILFWLINIFFRNKYITFVGLKRLLGLTIFLLMTNLYWIVPIVVNSLVYGDLRVRLDENILQEAVRRVGYFQSISQPLWRIIYMQIPFGLNTEFVYPVAGYLQHIFTFASLSVFLCAFMSLLHIRKNSREFYPLIYFYIVFMLFLGIISGNKNFIGQTVYSGLIRFSPYVFAGFSNPIRFFPVLFLSVAVLISYGLSKSENTGGKQLKIIFRIISLVLLCLNLIPWISGALTDPVVKDNSQPLSLKISKIQQDDWAVERFIDSQTTDFRVSYLPPTFSAWPGQTDHMFPWTTTFSSKNTFLQHSEEPLASVIISELFSQNSSQKISNLLGLANVRYIIFPKYQKIESYVSFIPNIFDYKYYLIRNWNSQKGLVKKDMGFSSVDIYENNDFIPHIYIPEQLSYISGNDDNAVVVLSEQSDYRIRQAIFSSSELTDLQEHFLLDNPQIPLSIYARPICLGCSYIRLTDNDLRPVSRFLPDSPLYALTLWKDGKYVKNYKDDIAGRAYAELVIGTKRLEEVLRLTEKKDVDLTVYNSVLDYYHTILKSFEEDFNTLKRNSLDNNDYFQKYLIILRRHNTLFDNITAKAKYSEVQKICLNLRQQNATLINSIDNNTNVSDLINGNLSYSVRIPIAGNYRLLQKKDGMDVQVDRLSVNKTGIPDINKINLASGSNIISIQNPVPQNLFRGFNGNITPQSSDSAYVIDSVRKSDKVSFTVSDLNPKNSYEITFEYTVKGNPVYMQIDQPSDKSLNIKDNFSVEKMLSDYGNWIKYRYIYSPNIFDSAATVVFNLANADLSYDPNSSPNQFSIRNIAVKPILKKDILLKKTGKTPDNQVVPKLVFRLINPTKYRVQITGATKPFFLVFSESFHKGWTAFFIKDQTVRSESLSDIYFNGDIAEGRHQNIFFDTGLLRNWGREAVPEMHHYKVNLFSNAWYIEKTGNFEMELEFIPQRIYMPSVLISAASLLFLVLYILIKTFKLKYE